MFSRKERQCLRKRSGHCYDKKEQTVAQNWFNLFWKFSFRDSHLQYLDCFNKQGERLHKNIMSKKCRMERNGCLQFLLATAETLLDTTKRRKIYLLDFWKMQILNF